MTDYAIKRIADKLEQIQDRIDNDNVDADTREQLVQTAINLRGIRIA